MLPLETNSSLNKCACTTHNKWGSWERPAWLNSKCCPNSNSPLCHCHSSLVLCSNTWTTSQPHCSHIQPQRCSSGPPPEPIEKGLLAAFPKRPLQAAVSCFFLSQDRSSRILAPNRQSCTRATGVQESPTTSFICMAVCVEVRFFLASHSKLLHLANFGNSVSSQHRRKPTVWSSLCIDN